MQKRFPDGEPYVLTHTDLNLTNILVHEGKIVAIIDWAEAGYYPWWVECLSAGYGDGGELFKMVWKELDLSVEDLRYDVGFVRSYWDKCPVGHGGETHVWQRPPFCKCKPFGGRIQQTHLITEEKHFVDYDKLISPSGRAYRKIHDEPEQN